MGWGTIISRRLKVFSLALFVYFDYKAVQKRVQWVSAVKKNSIWEKTHERNARRVLNLMIELEGLWVKMGQYLSTRADVLPEPYITVLKQLQDSLPPRPLEEVRGTIEKELGKPMSELFANFDNNPLATASIAQVHRATLEDGREVVVKIQHDGIKEIILEDLKNAKSLIEWIAWAEPQYDFNPMIDEWCKEAPKELDFNHEAENTRTVSRNLSQKTEDGAGSVSSDVDVLIPEVIQSTERVLVLQYMDGIRLHDNDSLEAYGVDKKRLVEEITRAYAHQLYIDGFFNGDPHPGNFLVSKEPPHKPILLDFGLTKRISQSMRQALAKMFLSCAEGDQVALLSAFAEMGLKLRVDMPQQSMDIATIFFRQSTTADEAKENIKALNEQRERNTKALQEKMKLNKKEVKHFNPVDAFPGDAIIFMRVLNLLRGLSASLNVRIVYLDIMRPFAESTLLGSITRGPSTNSQWIYDSPVNSEVESKLRSLLLEIGSEKILGIQVCAYKDGKVIIDTAAGSLGKYDPRPVQPDSLFPVFSVTKGITAGMVHWLVDKGKLKYDETVADIWPEFGTNKKELIKVHHLLNHTAGLHNALADVAKTDPLFLCDWEETLRQMAKCTPETEPGSSQIYHYLSFGWLCGGLIENASGKKFQEILEEAIVRPLQIDGELYIGIPPGVESRLAALTVDMEEIQKLSGLRPGPDVPPELLSGIAQMAAGVPALFNTLNIRRAIVPAANGHISARALARYYAALGASGTIPPPHSSSSKPPLGSHVHIPTLPTATPKKKKKKGSAKTGGSAPDKGEYAQLRTSDADSEASAAAGSTGGTMFTNSSGSILDAFMGVGEYSGMIHPNGKFGLGFRRYGKAGSVPTGFGHSGMGGSNGFCDPEHAFAIVVTVNRMSLGSVTRRVVRFVCEELGVPVPDRAGMIRALTDDVNKFFKLCDPEKENLCLYGYPNETWEVTLPAEEVPPEVPEPALGINFARDGMNEKDWLALVAVHSDSWLLSVAFYFGARFGFDKETRRRLFNMINNLPTIYEVVTGAAKRQSKEKTPNTNSSSKSNKPSSKVQSRAEPRAKAKLSAPKDEDEDSGDDGGDDEEEEHDNTLCGTCGTNDGKDEFWICCDNCEKWYHGKCVKITPARAEHIKQYRCPDCGNGNSNKRIKT